MIAMGMRREQPVRPLREFRRGTGPNDEVNVIRHQAIREDGYRNAQLSLADELDERIVVRRLVKDLRLLVGAIDEVVAPVRDDDPGWAWHANNLVRRPHRVTLENPARAPAKNGAWHRFLGNGA